MVQLWQGLTLDIDRRNRMRNQPMADPAWNRVAAGLTALAFLSLLARLLLQVPEPGVAASDGTMQAVWRMVLPARSPPTTDAGAAGPVPVLDEQAGARPPEGRQAEVASKPLQVKSTAPVLPNQAASAQWSQRLYGKDGEVDVPETGDGRQKSAVERVFEHRDELATGVGERATADLFSRRPAGSRQSMAQRLIFGRDVQEAVARRPPDVSFNPRLAEGRSDLGSEATGDAYKAAPIRYEKAPGLKGEASRRIRATVGELEGRYPRCSSEQRSRWMAPALAQLAALQRAEYRYNNGADPVEAEHSLPSAADSAYDLARRALWDAERRMKECR